MKIILFAIASIITMTFSSCYVSVDGRHHRHAAGVIIHASDNINPNDSLQSSSKSNSNEKDSLKLPVNPDAGKK